MPLLVKLAETRDELDALQRLRHRVYVEEERAFPPRPDGRLGDALDGAADVANVVALVGGEVVGAMRFHAQRGRSTDALFDFAPHLPAGARAGATSFHAVTRARRGTPRLASTMAVLGLAWCLREGFTHVVTVANPAREASFRACGYRAVAPAFLHDGLPCLPMVLDLAGLGEGFRDRVRRHARQVPRDAHARLVLQPGERLGDAPSDVAVLHGLLAVEGEAGALDVGEGSILRVEVARRAVARTETELMLLRAADGPTENEAPGLAPGLGAPTKP